MSRSVAAGLVLGYLADLVLGDPRRYHPVAGFGRVALAVEQRTYADSRWAGVGHTVGLVGASAGAGVLADRVVRGRPLVHAGAVGVLTWAVLGGRSLRREAAAVGAFLDSNDLPGARQRIRSLVGRDPSELDASELSRAVIESVAENSSDAVVAPLFWGAVAGPAGLLGYRALNTLDAMIGHHSPRYERFGWAAARLDDVANWVPARVSAALTVACAPLVGGSSGAAWRVWRRDAHQHPSPNAGPVEAAFAGALNVRLGGTNNYAGQVENRGELGDGPAPEPRDIARSNRLAAAVAAGAVVLATVGRSRLEAVRA